MQKLWRQVGWKELQVRMFRVGMSRRKIEYRMVWLEGQGKEIFQYAAVVKKAFAKFCRQLKYLTYSAPMTK